MSKDNTNETPGQLSLDQLLQIMPRTAKILLEQVTSVAQQNGAQISLRLSGDPDDVAEPGSTNIRVDVDQFLGGGPYRAKQYLAGQFSKALPELDVESIFGVPPKDDSSDAARDLAQQMAQTLAAQLGGLVVGLGDGNFAVDITDNSGRPYRDLELEFEQPRFIGRQSGISLADILTGGPDGRRFSRQDLEDDGIPFSREQLLSLMTGGDMSDFFDFAMGGLPPEVNPFERSGRRQQRQSASYSPGQVLADDAIFAEMGDIPPLGNDGYRQLFGLNDPETAGDRTLELRMAGRLGDQSAVDMGTAAVYQLLAAADDDLNPAQAQMLERVAALVNAQMELVGDDHGLTHVFMHGLDEVRPDLLSDGARVRWSCNKKPLGQQQPQEQEQTM